MVIRLLSLDHCQCSCTTFRRLVLLCLQRAIESVVYWWIWSTMRWFECLWIALSDDESHFYSSNGSVPSGVVQNIVRPVQSLPRCQSMWIVYSFESGTCRCWI
jgi:hypothetical protein